MLDAAALAVVGEGVGVRRPCQQPRRGQQHPARVVRHLQRHGGRRTRGLQQDRAPVGAELLRNGGQFGGDQLAQLRVGVQDPGQLRDLGVQPLLLRLQLDPVEFGQPAQRRVQDVLRLHVGQCEPLDQALLGLCGVLAGADQADHLVDVHQGGEQTLDQVQAVAPLAAPELAAPPHHVEPVVEVDLQQFLQTQRQRLAVDEGHVVDAEGLLHGGQLVELLQDRLRHEAVLDLDDQAQAVLAVGEVLDVGDALDLLGADQILDLGDDLLRTDREGQFGDDEALAAGRDRVDLHRGADLEGAPARGVRVPDAGQPDDPAAGGQVGARDVLHQGVQVRVRIADQMPGGGDHLAQVVRRHVRGHADRDPGGAVDQQVGEGGGQRHRFLLLAVVVRPEVDGVLLDGLRHQARRLGHPALGVPHGGRRVVIAQRAEVAVAVDQRDAHREGLRHADQGVVDRRVAVRVQLAHDLPDDAGALDVAAVGPQPHLVHLVDDAAVHRLEAVPGVGEGARVDDRVRVLEEGALHLVDDVDVEDPLLVRVVGRRGLGAAAGHRCRLLVWAWAGSDADHCGPGDRQRVAGPGPEARGRAPGPAHRGAGGGRAGTRAPVGEPRTGVAPRPLRGHIQWQDWHNSAVGHSRFS